MSSDIGRCLLCLSFSPSVSASIYLVSIVLRLLAPLSLPPCLNTDDIRRALRSLAIRGRIVARDAYVCGTGPRDRSNP